MRTNFVVVCVLSLPTIFGTGCSTNQGTDGFWQRFGQALAAPDYAAPAPNYSAPVAGTPQVIESQIDGDFNGWDGETIVKLTNGQIWQQTEYYYYYRYAFMPHVLVYRSESSEYKMRVDGVDKAVRVARLK